MYRDTITLFNRCVDSSGNTMWFPHVFKGVNLIVDKAVMVSKYGAENKDNAVLNVKYNLDGKNIDIDKKLYLEPTQWRQQTEDLQPDILTFKAGNDFDFFMLGDYGSEETVIDADDTFFREIQKQYDNVFAITSVSRYSVIPHFEILGK